MISSFFSWAVPLFQNIAGLALSSMILWLPLAAFASTRSWAGGGIILVSYAFGASIWIIAAGTLYSLWGVLGLLVGIFLFGFGVVPLAVIALLVSGAWSLGISLVFWVVLIFAVRAFGYWLTADER